MVVRLSDLPALWSTDPLAAPGMPLGMAGFTAPGTAPRGQLLLDRASTLAGVRPGGRGIRGIEGVPLSLAASECRNARECFITDRVFALVDDDGSMCLRLPAEIADDLVENGLCMRAGKNLLTWPVSNDHQLEIAWRILLNAYWNATGTPPKRARRLWSEWVINH